MPGWSTSTRTCVVVDKPPGVSTVPYEESETDTLEARVRSWLERRGKSSGARGSTRARRRPPARQGDQRARRLHADVARQAGARRRSSGSTPCTGATSPSRHGDVRSRTIRSFLLEDRGDGLRGSARGTPGSQAREAITHVERLEALRGATLVACRLETGRTHQIRIHLSEGGHPLLGERVYIKRFAGRLLEAPRLMLHAAELGFVHPATQREVRWERPMPADMAEVLERLRLGR